MAGEDHIESSDLTGVCPGSASCKTNAKPTELFIESNT